MVYHLRYSGRSVHSKSQLSETEEEKEEEELEVCGAEEVGEFTSIRGSPETPEGS